MKTQLVNLKGGAKLLFNRQTEINGVSVVFSFKAGAFNDPKGKLGVAHFLEHAMYNFPNAEMNRQERFDYSRHFQYSNAYTRQEEMVFVARVTNEKLEDAFNFITQPFASVKFSKEEFEEEQKVIRDEIITRHKSNEALLYYIYLNETINDKTTKKIISSPAGTLETFNKIKINDLEKFKDDYLTLNNLIITVVGNTTLRKVKSLVKKYVETRIKTSNVQGYKLKNPKYNKPAYHFRLAQEKEKGIFEVLYNLKPLPFNQAIYDEEFITVFLSKILNEMIFNYFRLEKNLCYSCSAFVCNYDDHLVNIIRIPCGENNLQAVIDCYKDFRSQLPTDIPKDVYEKFRERILNSFGFDFSQLDDISSLCSIIYQKENKLYSTKYNKIRSEKLKKVTYEDVNEMYKTLFTVQPHISIISNNEKFKDLKYQDFKI